MIIVVGSGPSGIAAATALLKRGCDVTMLDGGLTLAKNKNNNFIDPKIKLSHGSDYAYSEVKNHLNIIEDKNINCLPSFAQGGLSNVWGSVTEFYKAKEIVNWPINISEFAPHFAAIEKILNPAISKEEASDNSLNTYNSSPQAKALLDHWRKNKNLLHNLHFGTAKLATKFSNSEAEFCTYCGSCQHGCPLDLIYSARHSLSDLMKNPGFTYVSNCIVDNLRETNSTVEVNTYDLSTRNSKKYIAKQVFLGCGPIISSKLILEAIGKFNQKISFLDSTHFLLPSLMRQRLRNSDQESLHTLAQLYLKLQDENISNHEINLQLYTFMDHYLIPLKSVLKKAYPLFQLALSPLTDRLLAIQGHLNSSDSHGFTMFLDHNRNINLNSVINTKTKKIIQKLAKKLNDDNKELGLRPIKSFLSISKIGRSFHHGGSMPMRSDPNENESDIFGKAYGLQRIHIIDATIFPSIPAGSITPTIMANAHRIADECSLKD